jgi:UDP-N-acetylmuramyl pentapeptide phosphotransferase/UDP-N-acetylglucosamine-1-phosphate transferase
MVSVYYLSFALLLTSFFLTWIVLNISLKKNILDVPNERSSHSVPTPRGGGLAIVVVWYIGISALFMMGMVNRNLYFALMSGSLLAGISLIDDVIDLKPIIRLIAQTITVVVAFIFLHGIEPVSLFNKVLVPSIVLYGVTIIGMVWFVNLFNFLDGIDGYASVEAIVLAFALYLFTGINITLVLIASVIGFLIWNWPKARIFMGDVGSTQLGFILIVLGIYFHNEDKLSIIYWLILSAPFWFDATLTLFRRWRNNEILSQAHRKHIYQRLVQSGYSHLQVDIFLILINLILIFLVFICMKYSMLKVPLLFLTIIFLYLITIYTDRRKPF